MQQQLRPSGECRVRGRAMQTVLKGPRAFSGAASLQAASRNESASQSGAASLIAAWQGLLKLRPPRVSPEPAQAPIRRAFARPLQVASPARHVPSCLKPRFELSQQAFRLRLYHRSTCHESHRVSASGLTYTVSLHLSTLLGVSSSPPLESCHTA
jgi:hypothetical protein